jgi:hypothetical protein
VGGNDPLGKLFDGFMAAATSYFGPLGALLAFVVMTGLMLGAIIGVVWLVFTGAFSAAAGRAFVFTRRMAVVLSSAVGALVLSGFAIEVYRAIVEGSITTHPRHGTPQVYYWFEDRSGFIWAIVGDAFTYAGMWATIAVVLFKVASLNKKPSPTPPSQTSPQ